MMKKNWPMALLTVAALSACGGGGESVATLNSAIGEPAAAGRATILAAPLAAADTAPAAPAAGQRWSDPATWGGTLPPAGATVVIPVGKTVVLDIATPALKGLTVQGALVAAADKDVAITSDYVIVRGGQLQIGTAAAPYTRKATITLTGTTTAEAPGATGFGNKVLGLMGGSIELQGAPTVTGWTRLGVDVAKGARTLTLAEAPGWAAGDELVIATSDTDQNHYDQVTVQSISGNTVTLTTALKYKHFGAVRNVGTTKVDVRAEVGRLNRNIVVQGDTTSTRSKIGGHAMFMAGNGLNKVQIANTEFRRMGQHNQLGRYPLHFHLMAAACSGCYIKDSSVRDTLQRGIVLHGTSGITLAGNVVFNTVGHNIFLEDENTTGNLIDRNLALVNKQPSPLHTEPTLVSQNDRMPSNFWFKAGANTVTNNHAGGSFFNGFNYEGIDGGEDDNRVGLPLDFRNNTAHAAMGKEGAGAGDFDITGGLLISTEAKRPANDRIQDTLVYHNAVGIWPEESGVFVVDRFTAAENGLAIENRGVGNRQHYKNGLIVGKLPGSTFKGAQAMHHQYGSDTVLENITFAGFAEVGFASSDTGPTQSNFRLINIGFVGARPAWGLSDLSTFDLADDGIAPRGFYAIGEAPWLATPACVSQALAVPDDDPILWSRCPSRPSYAELEVRDNPASTFNTKVNPFLKRSDGLRYRLGEAGGENIGSGMHSTTVIYNAGLGYAVDAAPSAKGWAVRLSDAAVAFASADLQADTAWITLSLPVVAAPRSVNRTGTSFVRPNAATPANALRAASSLADFQANPLTTYFYDAAARVVRVQAGARWVIVTP